jgi:hypothetical protein
MITLNAKQQEEPIENLHLNWGSAGVRREDRQKFGLTHACLLFFSKQSVLWSAFLKISPGVVQGFEQCNGDTRRQSFA